MGMVGFAVARVLVSVWMDAGQGFEPIFIVLGPFGCFWDLWVILFGLTVARWRYAGPAIVFGVVLYAGAVLLMDSVSRLSDDYRKLELHGRGRPFLACIRVFIGLLAGLLITGFWKWERVVSKKQSIDANAS